MAFRYNQILNIPEESMLEKKLTKAFFLKNFDLSAAEKKTVNQDIAAMLWLACIKPLTSNIPSVINEIYKYEEIQVMVCTVHENQLDKTAERCIALFQKHIPYQIVLLVEDANSFLMNVCDKRINQNDTGKRTLERQFTTGVINKLYKTETTGAFFKALNFTNLYKTDLEVLYKSYIDTVVRFKAANITGAFKKRSHARTEKDIEYLETIEQLEMEIASLANRIKAASQLNQKVQLNIEIQEKRKELTKIKEALTN